MTLSDSQKAIANSDVPSGPNGSDDQAVVPSGVTNSDKPEAVLLAPSAPVATAAPVKPSGNTGGSAGVRIGGRGKTYVSRGAKGKGIALSSGAKGKGIILESDQQVLPFRDAQLGPHEGEVQFRLIHFWEAWNTVTKVLIGVEMLLIDKEV